MPSVLVGGPQMLLANILTPKRLICTYASDIAHPVPSHDHVLENRSMLCNCHMESGLTYLLKSIAFCETALGPQVYACIKQGKLKTLVATMALYKLPDTEAFNGTLPMSAPIVPNEGHAKYVCLDPWINASVTLASLRTIVAYIMIRYRRCTLCRGLECATACHIYVFISRNNRYSPIKLCSTTGLLYNFVTNQRLPMEALELHRGCPWDSMHINWGEVTLTNGDIKIRLPYNVQIPMREKSRLHSLMKGPNCTAHLMVLQGCTWYTVSTTPHHYPAMQRPFSPRSMNPLPPNNDDNTE